jgi:hypothetical protein
MTKTKSLAPDGSYSCGDQSINGYSQTGQELKEQFLREVFPLLWQTGEGLPWFEWIDCGIQINQSRISYAQWEHKRRKVYNKLS